MLSFRKELLKQVPKWRSKAPTLRYLFSQQKAQNNLPQKSSFFSSKVILSIGAASLLSYGVFKQHTKTQQNPNQGGKSGATPTVEVPAALKKVLDSHGKNSLEYAAALKEEGRQLYIRGERDRSMSMLQESLDIFTKLKGAESDEVASVYHELAQNLFFQRRIDESQKYMQKASEIHYNLGKFEQAFNELEIVAARYDREFPRGKELFDKIIQQRKEKLGANDPLLARTYIRLAMLYATQRRKEEVSENLEKAFGLMKSTKISKEGLAGIYGDLSLVYYNIRAFDYAINAIEKAIQNLDPLKDAAKIRRLKKRIGGLYSLLNNPEKTIEIFKSYAEELSKIEGANIFELGDTYNKLATQYERINNIPAAIESLDKAANLFKGIDELAVTYKMMSCPLYAKMGKTDKESQCFEEALQLAKRDLGETHELTKRASEFLKMYRQIQSKGQ